LHKERLTVIIDKGMNAHLRLSHYLEPYFVPVYQYICLYLEYGAYSDENGQAIWSKAAWRKTSLVNTSFLS